MAQLLDPDTLYPFLQDGLDYLQEKDALSGRQYEALSKTAKLRSIGSATIRTKSKAIQLRKLLAESVKAGDDEREFAKRIQGQVDLLRSDSNRILRTATKQSYTEGLTRTLEKPHIAEAVPYVMYVSTHDARTRVEHERLDGTIERVGTPEYQYLKGQLAEWNCRCSLIPITAKQAKARGVNVPEELLPQSPVAVV